MGLILKAQNKVEKIFKKVNGAIVFLLLRVSFIECNYAEVVRESYDETINGQATPAGTPKSADQLLEVAREFYTLQNGRLDFVLQKSSQLLTVIGLVLSIFALKFAEVNLSWPLLVALVLMGAAGWLILFILAVRPQTHPVIDKKMIGATATKAKALLTKDYLDSARQNKQRNDFIVDVYRASLRLLLAALIFSVALAVLSVVPVREFVGSLANDFRMARFYFCR